MIIIKVRPNKRRLWEFYLRRRLKIEEGKGTLEQLVEILILEEVCRESAKHLGDK